MAAGEYLSDGSRSKRRALIMAAATLLGSMLPAVPFATGYGIAQLVASGTVVVVGALIIGHFRGYRLTFAILTVVCALTVALSALVA